MHSLRNNAYEIPELECLVFCRREETLLKIFDIVASQIPRFEELYPYLAAHGDQRVEFHFHTDKLGLAETELLPLEGNHPFVKGRFPLERPVFPYTSRA